MMSFLKHLFYTPLSSLLLTRSSLYSKRSPIILRPSGNVLLDMSIGKRLTLGFLVAALIAATVASIICMQRTESLNQQSKFYQHLLQGNTSLTTGTNFLQMMSIETQVILNVLNEPHPSQETLSQDIQAVQDLSNRYDTLINTYITQDLLVHHTDMISLLTEANHGSMVAQQLILTNSTVRTWKVYHTAEDQFLSYAASQHVSEAQQIERIQTEPTFTDLTSSLHTLVQFNQNLVNSIQDAAGAEEQKLLVTTFVGAIGAFFLIVLVGWLISNTMIYRLHQLRLVTRRVEEGNLDARATVVGRDEIALVSASVNTMLETIVANRKIALEYEQQQQLNQMKDQFIINVSHELRTPLTQVYGYLELLSTYQGHLDSETQKTFLNNAKYGCDELMLLVNNILNTTHASSKLQSPQIEEVNIARVVQEVTGLLAPLETQKHTLKITIPEQLKAQADTQYLRQILRNLISNAFKYAPPDTSVSIDASLHTTKQLPEAMQEVCISVQDEGPGIPPGEQRFLFQKFTRLQRDLSGPIRGTGLGLYICKQLVEAMHGHIWVESSGIAGEGSHFCFTLPEYPLSSH